VDTIASFTSIGGHAVAVSGHPIGWYQEWLHTLGRGDVVREASESAVPINSAATEVFTGTIVARRSTA
jgi:hypothetical protein